MITKGEREDGERRTFVNVTIAVAVKHAEGHVQGGLRLGDKRLEEHVLAKLDETVVVHVGHVEETLEPRNVFAPVRSYRSNTRKQRAHEDLPERSLSTWERMKSSTVIIHSPSALTTLAYFIKVARMESMLLDASS